MGLVWFSRGLGGEILRTCKGNTILDPLPSIPSEKMRVSDYMLGTAEKLPFWEHYRLAEYI